MPNAALAQDFTLYDQLLALPENIVGEIVNGQLYTQSWPSGRHTLAHSELMVELGGPFDWGRGGPGGWWILTEPELHFIRDTEVVVPDLVGWHRERMPNLPDDHRFDIVPDWVCEILSPSQGPGAENAAVRPLRRQAPLADRSLGAHSGGVRVARGALESGRDFQG